MVTQDDVHGLQNLGLGLEDVGCTGGAEVVEQVRRQEGSRDLDVDAVHLGVFGVLVIALALVLDVVGGPLDQLVDRDDGRAIVGRNAAELIRKVFFQQKGDHAAGFPTGGLPAILVADDVDVEAEEILADVGQFEVVGVHKDLLALGSETRSFGEVDPVAAGLGLPGLQERIGGSVFDRFDLGARVGNGSALGAGQV